MKHVFGPLALATFVLAGCSAVLPPAMWPQSTPAVTTTPTGDATGSAAGAAYQTAAVSFKSDVVPILKLHCAECHIAGQLTPGMFDSSGNAQYDAIKTNIQEMLMMVQSKQMPMDKPGSVTSAELQTLQSWASAGAPNN